jgi:hypothetical protein
VSIPGSPRRQRPSPARAGGKPGKAEGGDQARPDQSEQGGSARAKTAVPPRGGQKRSGGARRPAPKRPPRGRQATVQAARRRRNLIAGTAVAVVVIVVAVLVIVFATSGSSGSNNERQPIPAAVLPQVTTPVPMSTLNAALAKESGQGNVVAPTTISGPPRTVNGKPELLYVGAEFCPICATERWPLTVALNQFGHFTNLRQIHSAADDGNIATLTYYQAQYTSPYLTFTTYEVENRNHAPLETPPAAVQSLWTNATKNIQGGPDTFPFIDMNGKWQLTSAQFADTTFTGASFNSIASAIGNNNNTYGLYINAAAAQLVHSICGAIGNKAPACASTGT